MGNFGICFHYEPKERDYWVSLVDTFSPDVVYEIGMPSGLVNNISYPHWFSVNSYRDIKEDKVLLQPLNGANIKGETSIKDHKHRGGLVYCFGSDNYHLGRSLRGLFKDVIYIPSCSKVNSLWSHQAASIALFNLNIEHL